MDYVVLSKSSSSLFSAIKSIDFYKVKLLLESGANANVRSVFGITPLYLAVELGYIDIASLLLEYNADIACSMDSVSVFHLSTHNPNMLSLIVNKKLVIMCNIFFPYNEKLQKMFLKDFLTSNKSFKFEEAVKFIIENNGNVNAKDQDMVSLLSMACAVGNYKTVRMLIEANIEKDFKDHYATALHYAFNSNVSEILAYLLTQGCNIDICDAEGDYPESWAVFEDRWENLQKVLNLKNSNNTYLVDPNKLLHRKQGDGKSILEMVRSDYKDSCCACYIEEYIKKLNLPITSTKARYLAK